MSVAIVESECRVEEGKLVIVVQGANPEEVLGQEAKALAVKTAASYGYSRVGINSVSGSYPVDNNGVTYDDWNKQALERKIMAYRNDIRLMSGL